MNINYIRKLMDIFPTDIQGLIISFVKNKKQKINEHINIIQFYSKLCLFPCISVGKLEYIPGHNIKKICDLMERVASAYYDWDCQHCDNYSLLSEYHYYNLFVWGNKIRAP